jgi:uncharacterized protein with NRDE domain
MCTIAALRGVHPAFPLIVAANRDEFYARAATAPALHGHTRDGDAVWAGEDTQAGGTWMGATARGFFVGLTNQRSLAPRAEGRRSRGEVVLECLRAGSAGEAERTQRALDPAQFNPFNLLFGDAADLRVAYVRDAPGSIEVHPLPQGTHVLANDRLGSAAFPKTQRMTALLAPDTIPALGEDALIERLTETLRDPAFPPDRPRDPLDAALPDELARRLQALCVETPVYGTVSSTVMLLTEGAVHRYLYAPGPPRSVAFGEVPRGW